MEVSACNWYNQLISQPKWYRLIVQQCRWVSNAYCNMVRQRKKLLFCYHSLLTVRTSTILPCESVKNCALTTMALRVKRKLSRTVVRSRWATMGRIPSINQFKRRIPLCWVVIHMRARSPHQTSQIKCSSQAKLRQRPPSQVVHNARARTCQLVNNHSNQAVINSNHKWMEKCILKCMWGKIAKKPAS